LFENNPIYLFQTTHIIVIPRTFQVLLCFPFSCGYIRLKPGILLYTAKERL